MNKDIKKVVLAYSGGLDTSVILKWLIETYKCEVITVTADLGQPEDLSGVEAKAYKTGASKAYVVDLREEMARDFVFPMMRGAARYENRYMLGTSIARPIITKALVDIARKEGADAIAHGATGKGNDQVRFELAMKAFAPDLKVIAAWRDPKWTLQSREDEVKYLEDRKIPVPVKKENSYSCDENIWHISHEGLELEETPNEPKWENMLKETKLPEQASEKGEYVTIEFVSGEAVSVNGKKMSPLEIMQELNKIAGRNGIGIVDLVENRVVGMKSRGVYETPGGTILMYAHEQLDHLCLDRDTYHFKQMISLRESELIYDGKWFTQLMEGIMAFQDKIEENVTGWVKLRLYKGTMRGAGSDSPYSLYNESIASFATGDLYDHKDADGFITLFGLPLKVRAMMEQKAGKGQAVPESKRLKKRPTE